VQYPPPLEIWKKDPELVQNIVEGAATRNSGSALTP
jgi:hypothetical protein